MNQQFISHAKYFCTLFMSVAIVFTLFSFGVSQAAQLETYKIKKCSKEKICWIASGNVAYVDNSGTYISAEKGKLEIVDLNKNTSEQWSCDSLNYNLTSELLMCNNSEGAQASKVPSIIIDRFFRINKISINLALHAK